MLPQSAWARWRYLLRYCAGMKKILSHWLEIAAAVLLIYLEAWGPLIVLGYLVIANFNLHHMLDYHRAAARTWQLVNEVRLLAMVRKLGISDEELKRVEDEMRAKAGPEAWASLEKDWSK